MADDDGPPPRYFREFLAEFCVFSSDVCTRMAEIEHAIDERLRAVDTELLEVREDIKALKQNVSSSTASKPDPSIVDECEILIVGVPSSLSSSKEEIVRAVLTVLKLQHLMQLVISCRDWTARLNTPASLASSSTCQPSNRSSTRAPTRSGVVYRLASATMRDSILASSNALRGVNCDTIFGGGGSSQVYLCPLWPKPVHALLGKAIVAAKSLNYARPTVRNLTVFMRETRDAPLVPIASRVIWRPSRLDSGDGRWAGQDAVAVGV